jgi:hypothetical protein
VRNIGGFECGGDEEEERVRGVERLGKRALYWKRKEFCKRGSTSYKGQQDINSNGES